VDLGVPRSSRGSGTNKINDLILFCLGLEIFLQHIYSKPVMA